MAATASAGVVTGKPLIESDRVEGTAVYKLDYDTSLGGFRTDITEDEIRGAPNFYRDRDFDWSDRQRERELHDYWKAPYYWGI